MAPIDEPRKAGVPRFQSIISRIVILHIVAVVITSVVMSLALSWLLNYATNNIHNKAMQDQAIAVGEHLRIGADGRLGLELPADLLGLYSQEYGRYSYAVTDDQGRVLFSSLSERAALFTADPRVGGNRISAAAARRWHGLRRQHPQERRRSNGLDSGRRGSRQSRRADR